MILSYGGGAAFLNKTERIQLDLRLREDVAEPVGIRGRGLARHRVQAFEAGKIKGVHINDRIISKLTGKNIMAG